jgi:hypothetical protein
MGQSCSPYCVPVMDSGFLFLTGNADTVYFWGLRGTRSAVKSRTPYRPWCSCTCGLAEESLPASLNSAGPRELGVKPHPFELHSDTRDSL